MTIGINVVFAGKCLAYGMGYWARYELLLFGWYLGVVCQGDWHQCDLSWYTPGIHRETSVMIDGHGTWIIGIKSFKPRLESIWCQTGIRLAYMLKHQSRVIQIPLHGTWTAWGGLFRPKIAKRCHINSQEMSHQCWSGIFLVYWAMYTRYMPVLRHTLAFSGISWYTVGTFRSFHIYQAYTHVYRL